MSKNVAETTGTELAMPKGSWGTENIDSDDILISKILCAQAISDVVTSQEISIGAFYDSVEQNVLAKYNAKDSAKNENLEVILFSNFKSWVIHENGEYAGIEDFTPQNASWPYEEEIDGVKITRDLVNNFYGLLPSEIKVDGENVFPYVVPFKRTSAKAGKKISTTGKKLQLKGLPLAAAVFELSRTMGEHKESGGKYLVVDAKYKRATTDIEMKAAYKWYTTLQQKSDSIRVDDSDEKGPSAASNVNAEDSEF